MGSKSALALLLDYGGDSSDEDVPGYRTSTKRMHKDDDDDEHNVKRLQRLPVPDCMTTPKTEEYVEDPLLHGGRLRSFPHERGNWATYVYIHFQSNEALQKIISTILELDAKLQSVENFHISLTRTVILRHHWIELFVNSVREQVSFFTRFIVMFDSVNVFCNEERTRTFIGLQVKAGYDSLFKLTQILDVCLQEFKLPPFYKNPSFHLSIAWCLGDCEEMLKSHLPALNRELQEAISHCQEDWYIYVQNIFCKTGNKYFQFNLT